MSDDRCTCPHPSTCAYCSRMFPCRCEHCPYRNAGDAPTTWTQADAIALCRSIEEICPAFGCHVALTGGLLYKDGARKDADILFYRIRQADKIDAEGLFSALGKIGIERASNGSAGWVAKATYRGRRIDFFFPEVAGGTYAEDADAEPDPVREPLLDLIGFDA